MVCETVCIVVHYAEFQQTPSASLVFRKWLDTPSVIPAKAGIQLTFLWIPACEFVNKSPDLTGQEVK